MYFVLTCVCLCGAVVKTTKLSERIKQTKTVSICLSKKNLVYVETSNILQLDIPLLGKS